MSASSIHVCIGAPQSGTAWLANSLMQQSSVFVPAVKEVRYWFSRRNGQQRDADSKRAEAALNTLQDRELQQAWLNRWREIDPAAPPNGSVYRDLMSVSGLPSLDISPAYSFMPTLDIPKLHEAVPDTGKVIMIVRNPMVRMMSQMELHWHGQGNFRGAPSPARISSFVKDPMQLKRSDYRRTSESWGDVFGDRFQTFFYEDLQQDRYGFLKSVADFLGITLSDSLARDSSQQSAGTNPIMDFKASGSVQKTIAKAVYPLIRDYADIAPERARPWLNEVATTLERPHTERDHIVDCSPKVQDLMRMCESLGDNCEYGFWQRHRGYEPSSLFRWAITPAESLLEFLKSPDQDMYLEANLSVHSPGMVSDAQFGFKFHSKLVEPDGADGLRLLAQPDQWQATYRREKAKLDYLQGKFRKQISQKPCVYILKSLNGINPQVVFGIRDQLLEKNPQHRVLWVEEGTNGGQIEEIDHHLLRGEIDHFARYISADKYSPEGWTLLMHSLADRSEISEMIENMAR